MSERIIYEACPLCEKSNISSHRTGDASGRENYVSPLNPIIVWKKCLDCSHVFAEGYFTDESYKILFSETLNVQKVGGDIENNRIVSSKIVDKVLPYISEGVWLDVGFGNGSLLFTAQEYGFKPVGLDLRTVTVNQMLSLGIDAYCANLTDLKLPAKCAVISMANVLEHMPYPKTALKAANELLEDDGVLFLSMPNSEHIVWDLLDNANSNPYWGEIEHFHNFSRTQLYSLLTEFGFTPVRYGISERYRVGMEIIAIKNSSV